MSEHLFTLCQAEEVITVLRNETFSCPEPNQEKSRIQIQPYIEDFKTWSKKTSHYLYNFFQNNFYFSEGTKNVIKSCLFCLNWTPTVSEGFANLGSVRWSDTLVNTHVIYFVGCVRNGFLCFPKQLKKFSQNVENRNILGNVRMSNLMHK